ncbi:MAG: 16S rRNA (adenine(1518)-N(6)/adenine(1519)-N(6))-dimethyltransferase RsmA [Candidatus Staskawiczbacteria bacterium]|nr:16S rRNA (adenine(1518)-N(6)/adenine(1519)-N(6))-dimethyltransferase RsmA [Candidatus Staskawiczbacteria bacterium]
MELTSPKIIKELLAKYQTRPSKGLGQNFLIDKNILEKIIDSADIKPTDIVLEVGPGMGVLTQELAKKAKRVIAVEKDETMIEILKETINNYKNLEVIQGDILKTDLKLPKKYKVIANIPYYITAPLIRFLLENKNQPEEIILMLQKEVAQRICPSTSLRAGSNPHMSLLAVSVQFYAQPKIVSYVSKGCFWPSPKIDSAIIKITPTKKYDLASELFFKIVKAGFSHPRKQLAGNLSQALDIKKEKTAEWLAQNKINPTQRAETLSIDSWIALAKSFSA